MIAEPQTNSHDEALEVVRVVSRYHRNRPSLWSDLLARPRRGERPCVGAHVLQWSSGTGAMPGAVSMRQVVTTEMDEHQIVKAQRLAVEQTKSELKRLQ
jgi:hypothetical protein